MKRPLVALLWFLAGAIVLAVPVSGPARPCADDRPDDPCEATPAPISAQSVTPAHLVDPALMQRAHAEGAVRVIVELGGLNVMPEGFLRDDVAVSAQRQSIGAAQSGVRHALRGIVHRVGRQFQTVPLMTIDASPDVLRMLESMRGLVVAVHEDTVSAATLAQSGPLVGAPAMRDIGFDGSGTVIAILDTGVDRNHSFLAGKVVEEACFSSTVAGTSITACPNGGEEQGGPGSAMPCSVPGDCEHGTHVAGIAGGAGPTLSGIARGAKIVAIQVFSRFTRPQDCDGAAPCALSFRSDQIAALERVFLLRASHNLASVNMSMGGGGFTSPCDGDPRKLVIDNLRAVGIATVISSGNDGFGNALSAPACISTAVSVGATTKSDTVPTFSNSASFLSLVAPGSSINSSIPGGGFAVFDGTSMAAPHVAGAFAILRQAVPAATVSHILQALQVSGRPVTDVTGITTPRIKVDAALTALGFVAQSPFAVIESNGTSFRAGQTIVLTLTAANPLGNPPLDLYAGSLWPDLNTIAFLSAPNTFGGLGQYSAPASVAPMITIAPGFSATGMPLLTYTFPIEGIPMGTYHVFASLFRQGSLRDNRLDTGDLIGLNDVPVSYSP